jgi:hypothetical protein
MKMHKLKITTPGHFLVFNGKKLRTPIVFEKITEDDLLFLKSQIRQQNLKYTLDDEEPKLTQKLKEKTTSVEELYSKDSSEKSILGKLLEME